MELKTVVKYLNMQLDGWCKSNPFYCVIAATMDEYKKTSSLIGACWHDNRELEDAIAGADTAFKLLKAARERAVARFRAHGVCFHVCEAKRKELEAGGERLHVCEAKHKELEAGDAQ